jgi:uncharacterized protein YdbL (DUF1318 family)
VSCSDLQEYETMIELKNKMNRTLPALLVLALFSLPASALNLGQAKAQGLVKETSSGYLAVNKSSAEVETLVKKINAGRKAEYKKIAEKQKAPLSTVEQLAGKKLSN